MASSRTYLLVAYSIVVAILFGSTSFVGVAQASTLAPTVTSQAASAITPSMSVLHGTITNATVPYLWLSITSSSDGAKLAAVPETGDIYTSTNGGLTWTDRTAAGTHNWRAITSSADGVSLAAAESNGDIYTSTNGGLTWTDRTAAGSHIWRSITSSSDGANLAAAVWGASDIYTSTNGGLTWTDRTDAGTRNWYSITSSSDGANLAAAAYGGDIYTSTNGGLTWTDRTDASSHSWYSITSSADGTKLAAVINGADIYTSTNGGLTWTEQTGSGLRAWYSITSSADGTKLAAVTNGGDIYTSTNGGLTWTDRTTAGSRDWYSITSSADGTKLAAIVDGGDIYTSIDGGATWTDPFIPSVRGFVYGATTAYGATTTESGSFSTGAFTTDLSSLSCNTTYHYTSYATNGGGTNYGADRTFTTNSCPPVLTVSDASSITKTTATLNGAITDTGGTAPTIRGFMWGLTTAYGATTTESGSFSTGAFTTDLSSLSCNTTYHYTSYATNAGGTSYGSDTTFTTSLCPPTLTAAPASSVTQTAATLHGAVTDIGSTNPTIRGFAWGLTTAYGATTTESGSFSTGAFTTDLLSLSCNTTYHYTSYATNGGGTSYGSDTMFTTNPCPPTLTTASASSVGAGSATLHGAVTDTGGATPTIRGFMWGRTTAYGATTTESGSFSTGAFTTDLLSLSCNTTYHYTSYATNAGGTSYGSDILVTMGACTAPALTSDTASAITQTAATLNGTITDTGGTAPTVRGFAWGTTTAYGATTTESGSFSIGAFTVDIASLTCNGTYHVASYATNDIGTSYGSDVSFTTSSCTVQSSGGGGGGGSSGGGGGGGIAYVAPTPTVITKPATSRVSVTSAGAGLTPSQTQAILSLLQSFGADQTTVAGVQAALSGSPTPTTVSGAGAYLFESDLTLGSTGDSVTALQQYLASTGVYQGPVTGYFGPLTQVAVRTLQQQSGITPATGVVGPKTRAMLNGQNVPTAPLPSVAPVGVPTPVIPVAPSAPPVVETPPVVAPTPIPVVPSPFVLPMTSVIQTPPTTNTNAAPANTNNELMLGASGDAVTALQQVLARKGFYTGPTTGVFGPATQAAVQKFQKANGITPSGSVGPLTQKALLFSGGLQNLIPTLF